MGGWGSGVGRGAQQMVRSSDLVAAPHQRSPRILWISFMCAFAQELIGKAIGPHRLGEPSVDHLQTDRSDLCVPAKKKITRTKGP